MIYLLHFRQPLKHARHYVGFSTDKRTFRERMNHHASGTSGVRILEVIKQCGIEFEIAATWEGDRTLERKLHRHGKTRICPICNPQIKLPKRLKHKSV